MSFGADIQSTVHGVLLCQLWKNRRQGRARPTNLYNSQTEATFPFLSQPATVQCIVKALVRVQCHLK